MHRKYLEHPALRGAALTLAGTVVAVLAATGCGTSSSGQSTATTAGSTSTSSPTATPATTAAPATSAPITTPPTTAAAASAATTPTTVPAGPQPCTTSELALSLSGANGAAGSTFVELDLRNTTAVACTLTGYPGVSYVGGGNGTQIGAAAARDPSIPVTTVTLGAGQTAQSQLQLVNPENFDPAACAIRPTQGLRVYPPGQTAAGFVSLPGQACSSTALPGGGATLNVAPVRAA